MIGLVVAAGGCGVAVLAGWAFDLPLCKTFGLFGYQLLPLSALGFIALSAGFLATLARSRAALWWIAIALCIAAGALLETLSGVSFGIDALLFPQAVAAAASGMGAPGRPGLNTILVLLLLGAALLLTARERRRWAEVETSLAAAALYFGVFSIVVLVAVGPRDGTAMRSLVSALPGGLATIGLASAFLLWRQRGDGAALLAGDRVRYPRLGLLLPLGVLVPMLPSLIERWGSRGIAGAPLWSELLAVACNVAILAGLLWMAVARLVRQQKALRDSTLALDGAEITLTDSTGRILLWSRGCEQLYGWTAAEALGRNKYDLLQSRCEQIGRERPFGVVPGELELIERRRDGAEISVIERTHRIERAAAEPLFVLRMLDISHRVRTEVALRSSEARLRSVLKAVPSPMMVVDQDGAIVEFSPAAERLWDYSIADVAGRPLTLLAPPEEHARFRGLLDRQLRSDLQDWRQRPVPVIALTRDGRRLTVEVSTGRADTAAGTLVTMFFRDISDRLAGEQRLSDLHAELAHVSRQSAMSELAADLAHELNQPLSATANYLAAARMLIAQGVTGERIADLLRMGEEQTQRSGEIIRRLRDFLAKRDAEMRPESLAHVVHEAVELVLFGASQSAVRLTYDLDAGADMVFADRIQVQQVLVNLLRNAVDALRGQPEATRSIVVASRVVKGGLVEVSVADSGPGLPEAIKQQLYARFATTKQGSGMGIGLSISRRIIEAHGGTLVAENQPEGGAVFRFTLPALEGMMA